MNRRTATLGYNFETASWMAIADWNTDLTGEGTTPDEAVEHLRHQCNKHELWPKDGEGWINQHVT